jgi:ribosomal protein S18 acetylase RimI-like enzyme
MGIIRTRIAARDDESIVRIIRQELLPFTRATMPGVKVNRKEIRRRLDGGTTYIAAHRGRETVGFVSCLKRNGVLVIDMLAVDRMKHGAGWGTALMEAAERFGRRHGCTEARLYVDQMNRGAQRFYAKKGYSFHRYVPTFQCFEMGKRL